jgi:hypothetical protein
LGKGCSRCDCHTQPSCESGTPKKLNGCKWFSTGPKNKDGFCCSAKEVAAPYVAPPAPAAYVSTKKSGK